MSRHVAPRACHVGARTLLAALAMATVAATIGGGSAGAVPHGSGEDGAAPRVFMASFPRLTWERLESVDTPRIDEFLQGAAVASLSTRTVGARTPPGNAYLTIGAGNRTTAAGPFDAGEVLDPQEATDGGSAAEVYQRRTRTAPTGEVLSLEWAQVESRNDELLYGSKPGSLGTTLADAGIGFAPIANADAGFNGDPQRQGALALLDGSGQAPLGEVGQNLLMADPLAPAGVRMDPAVVSAATQAALDGGAEVLLVEMSDLERAEQARLVATDAAADSAYDAALEDSDVAFGRLVSEVAGPGDLVVLMAPTAPLGQEQLTVFALASPESESGWARSSATRRDGYVSLTDIAATVVDFLELEMGDGMSDTPVTTVVDSASLQDRIDSLVAANDRAVFRDDVVGPLTVSFIVLLVAMLVLVAVGVRWGPWASAWLRYLSLVVMAIPAVTYLGGLLPYSGFSMATYGLALLTMAAAVSGVVVWVSRLVKAQDDQFAPVLVAAFTISVLAVDVLTGGHLQLDTVFGYSPIVAGRFSGFGNQAFSLISVSAVLLACGGWVLAERHGRTRGRLWAVLALFAFVVAVVGAPSLGSDVGGVLASVPAFAVCVLLLTGRRIRLRSVAWIAAATVAVLAVFTAIDLARPAESRTHLGRFAERILDGEALLILERKLNANMSVLTTTVWTWVIPAALLFLVYLTWRPNNLLRQINETQTSFRAFGISAITLGLLAWALNDSGVSMPAMMLAPGRAALHGDTGHRGAGLPAKRSMTAVALALLAGGLVAAGFWAITAQVFESGPLMRANYRNAVLPTALGVLIPLTVLVLVAAGHLALLSTNRPALWYTFGRTTLLASLAFSLLGLLDDVAGIGQSGGFRSHVRSVLSGNLSTGAVKVIGGAAAGVLVAASVPLSQPDVVSALRDGAVIALAANLANLFDRAPGRSTKFSTVGFAVAVGVAALGDRVEVSLLAAPAVAVGAALGLLWADLREKAMLGDAGANPLGALVGLSWLVVLESSDARWVLLAFLVLANAASELVSYSAVIDRVGPLRWFDRVGSLRS